MKKIWGLVLCVAFMACTLLVNGFTADNRFAATVMNNRLKITVSDTKENMQYSVKVMTPDQKTVLHVDQFTADGSGYLQFDIDISSMLSYEVVHVTLNSEEFELPIVFMVSLKNGQTTPAEPFFYQIKQEKGKIIVTFTEVPEGLQCSLMIKTKDRSQVLYANQESSLNGEVKFVIFVDNLPKIDTVCLILNREDNDKEIEKEFKLDQTQQTPTPSSTVEPTPTPTKNSGGGGGGGGGGGTPPILPTPTVTSAPTASPTSSPAIKLADLPEDHWAHQDVQTMIEKGIISGDGDGSDGKIIRPDGQITREEATKVALLGAQIPADNEITNLNFIDNGIISSWAIPYISSAVDRGILSGYPDNTFGASYSMTREEFAVLISKAFAFGTVEGEDLSFADSAEIGWSKPFVAKAVELGIIRGYEDNTFRPNEPVSRAEAFAMVSRAMRIKENAN